MANAPHILMIDNYDSFTYNLVQAFLALGARVGVYRNDALTLEQAAAIPFSHLVISPGPGTPAESGISLDLLRTYAGKRPTLGVCLGHQAMAEVFSGPGSVQRAPRLMHGKASTITHDGHGLYRGIAQGVEVGRYHSLCVVGDRVPPGFVVTSQTDAGEIMGMRHAAWKMEGVQFHPESVLTPQGPEMLRNFLTND
jgi:anthranilate synthase/aminodeoxychorismate synthase-like glutamine amidotransferase